MYFPSYNQMAQMGLGQSGDLELTFEENQDDFLQKCEDKP
jgi:hypothetical protein